MITQTLEVDAGVAYTVAATGMKTKLSFTVFTDDNRISDNSAKIRVYHLSPNVNSVTLATDKAAVVTGLPYQQASDYLSVSPNTNTIAATINPGNVTITVPLSLKSWTVTSLFAIGLLNGEPKLRFVQDQENGVPGLPSTGGDPTVSSSSPAMMGQGIWLLLLVCCLMVVVSVGTYRRVRTTRLPETSSTR